MYIEIKKKHKNENGKWMKRGEKMHVTNDYARELINLGVAKQTKEVIEENPENEAFESSVEKNEPAPTPKKPRKRRSKK